MKEEEEEEEGIAGVITRGLVAACLGRRSISDASQLYNTCRELKAQSKNALALSNLRHQATHTRGLLARSRLSAGV
jgi:hypothetical protein